MLRVSAFYPNRPGITFNHSYYNRQHRALVKRLWGPYGLQRIEMDRGVAGAGGTEAPFVAVGHLYFASAEAFQRAFEANGAQVLADIPNYTDVEPTLQISEIAPEVELPPIQG